MKNKVLSTSENITWQWDNNPVSILNAMEWWSKDPRVALSKLKEGQANNQNAQSLYDAASETLANFWNLVFYTTWSKADFSALEANLKWQRKHEWDSLAKSRKAWWASPKQEIWAYYHLLWGQRENPEALKIYRACWQEDKDRVMSLVNEIAEK